MPTELNRCAKRKLLEEDLAWLLSQPRSLERDHIEDLLRWNISGIAEDGNTPTGLRCHKCGRIFIWLDAVSGLCDSCIMDELFDVPFLFWVCPDHRRGQVSWNGDLATCETCGKTNKRELALGRHPSATE